MTPGDNSNLIAYDKNYDYSGLKPRLTYAVSGTTVTVTDASTIAAGDTLKAINVTVADKFGNEKKGGITAAGGNVAINTTGLNNSKGLTIAATVVTDGGLTADGTAHVIGAAGELGSWALRKSAAEAFAMDEPEEPEEPEEGE